MSVDLDLLPERTGPPPPVRIVRLAATIVAAAILVVSAAASARDAYFSFSAAALLAARGDDLNRVLSRPMPERASADLFYAIGVRATDRDPPDLELSRAALTRASARDPTSADIWCNLAHVEYRLAHSVSAPVLDNLKRCFRAEPAGFSPIGRWRLDFVLRLWGSVDDEIRRSARQQMDYMSDIDYARRTLDELASRQYPQEAQAELRSALLAE